MTMPPLPHHPESHTYGWTKPEIAAMLKYGRDCAAAERERIALWLKDNYQDYATIAGVADAIRGQS